MRKKSILQVLFVFTVICFVTTSCDNNLTNVENIGNTNDENQSNEIPSTGNQTNEIPCSGNQANGNPSTGNQTNESPNNDIEDVVVDYLNLLRGTVWHPSRGTHFIEFPNNHLNQILFRNNQNFGSAGGNLNTIVTHGNFRISAYDGRTMKIIAYNGTVVSFSAIISENTLTISGLGLIRWTSPPLEPRNFSSWNGTFVRR